MTFLRNQTNNCLRNQNHHYFNLFFILFFILFSGCSIHFLKKDKEASSSIKEIKEYESLVKVKDWSPEDSSLAKQNESESVESQANLLKKELEKTSKNNHKILEKKDRGKKEDKQKGKVSKKLNRQEETETSQGLKVNNAPLTDSNLQKRWPEYEDSENFEKGSRRPQVDPFRVGEKVTFAMTYFNVAAGYVELEVLPFKQVNGRKAYHFRITAKSSKIFSYFYAVDDYAETFVDYETLLPYNLGVFVKESKQLKEIRVVHDYEKSEGHYWEKRITQEKGEESKSKKWKLGAFTQNVISAAFYVRIFQFQLNKNLGFEVSDEGKNLMFKGTIIRKEKLKTEVGELDTFVLQPNISIDGIFKPIGEVFLWFTADDRKQIVRIESKIKIGTVVAKLQTLKRE